MIQAYAAMESGGTLEPFEYDPGQLGPKDVEIDVKHCGICHSDLSMINNDWGIAAYPLVPGHEVAGVVAAVGSEVKALSVGDRVGLGWHAGYCMDCHQCMEGDHNLCAAAQPTIVGHHGGFANKVRAHAASVIPIPDALDLADVGPLFCGGITVFNPLLQFGVRPTDSVGVIGIGGLGHLALKFANAWGGEVTAFTSTGAKENEARQMGAHHTINSRDPEAIAAAAGRFDIILSTVNVKLDWNAYINALKPKGRLHFLGATLEPLDLSLFPMLVGQRSISASPVGSPVTISRMLEFSARHGIQPITEHFPMNQVNEALAHLASGKARYRVILDN